MVNINRLNDLCVTFSQMNIIFNVRNFWKELATWTRTYLYSRYAGIGNAEELFAYLYSVPANYTNMLRLIYGVQFSERYFDLFNEHIIILRDMASAQKEGNIEAIKQNVIRLSKNADSIAEFLASYNPFFDRNKIRELLTIYNQYIIDMANSFSTGEYAKVLEAYDQLLIHTETIGDYLSQGLSSLITSGNPQNNNQTSQQCITYSQMLDIFNIRNFWFEMAAWTRAYFISRYTGIGAAEESYRRLNRTVEDYVARLRPFFGDKITEEYLQLLYTHNSLIASLVSAQLEGNTDAAGNITMQLYQNADERAKYLSSINPFWEENELRNRLYRYTQSTLEEMTTFLRRDFARNTDIFKRLLTQSESTGDYFSQGLFNYISQSKGKEIMILKKLKKK